MNNNRVHRIREQTLNCTLDPWDNYKHNKFTDKSYNSRLSTIKSCAGKQERGTVNESFKGSGRMNARGYANVQTSSSRTTTLANIVCRCGRRT